ncbi:hypothetical protein HDU79_001322 [Rhizoclosmatium sp. JEL0117]|nr:hypothetical protein HDU79_001322 [Rhizoclosmatium sp. JEL0117]
MDAPLVSVAAESNTDAGEVSNVEAVSTVEPNAEMLSQMENLITAQREHLKVRESHMDIMREALADLAKKREELVSLRVQVSDAIERNDVCAVNEAHARITVLEESQSQFHEMLEASQAIRESALYKTDDNSDSDDIENTENNDKKEDDVDNEADDEDDTDTDTDTDTEFNESDSKLNDFIAANLASLLAEVSAIDPSTESSAAASSWVADERDSLIAQLEDLQRQSLRALNQRSSQIAVLQQKQAELEDFQRQIIELEGQIEHIDVNGDEGEGLGDCAPAEEGEGEGEGVDVSMKDHTEGI